MGSRSHIEHDFLGMQQMHPSCLPPPQPQPRPRLDRRQSFRGISKIKPEIVRSVIASASNPQNHPNLFSSKEKEEEEEDDEEETAPMTIFYKGSVSVVNLPREKAENIINFVMEKSSSINHNNPLHQPSSNVQTHYIPHTLDDEDLSIKRNKSLQKFFEKRKERLIAVSPYQVDNVSQQHKKSFT